MAKKNSSSISRLLGIVLILAGIGIAYWGYQMSGDLGSRINRTFTGSFTNDEMIRFIGGGVCALAGIYLVIKK